jgi:hypothetical protein
MACARSCLRQNTAFFQSGALARRKQAGDLISRITATEQEIAAHHPLPYQMRLSDANSHLFNVVNRNMHRLEELCYAYQKRLFVVEASQDSEKEVVQRHGSIQELMRAVEAYERENRLLRDSEKTFIGNPVTRRRKFAVITPYCARHFAGVFGVMLRAERTCVSAFRRRGFADAYAEADLPPVDSVLTDPGFSGRPDSFDAAEFGNATEAEIIVPLVESSDLGAKLQAYELIVKKSAAVLRKLATEIDVLKAK